MKLFSWFMKRNDITSSQVVRMPLELNGNKNNTMWPVAQVRKSTQTQQQEYIMTVLDLSHNKTSQLNAKKT